MNLMSNNARIFLGSQSAGENLILKKFNNLEMQFLIVENCVSKLSLSYNKINLIWI